MISTGAVWNGFEVHISRLLGSNFNFTVCYGQTDPVGRPKMWISCKKHRVHKKVQMPYDGFPSDEMIMKTAQSCEGCIEEQASILPATRWPNAGEEGGAEL